MQVSHVPVEVSTRSPTGTTNAYVVGEDPAVLVDPAARTDALDAAVADCGVDHVVVTHTHPDHVGAVAEYSDDLDATTWARHGRTGRYTAATGVEPDETFRDGDRVGELTIVDTPGHAVDHVAFQAGETMLTGDLAVATGSVVVAHPEGDLRAYLTSLRRVRARAPASLQPGHGPTIDDPRGTCERLIRHRLDRESRVLAAVENGARTVAAVTDAAYDKDLTGVRDLAERTVHAHLQKLAHEGRVAWRDDDTVVSTI